MKKSLRKRKSPQAHKHSSPVGTISIEDLSGNFEGISHLINNAAVILGYFKTHKVVPNGKSVETIRALKLLKFANKFVKKMTEIEFEKQLNIFDEYFLYDQLSKSLGEINKQVGPDSNKFTDPDIINSIKFITDALEKHLERPLTEKEKESFFILSKSTGEKWSHQEVACEVLNQFFIGNSGCNRESFRQRKLTEERENIWAFDLESTRNTYAASGLALRKDIEVFKDNYSDKKTGIIHLGKSKFNKHSPNN